MEISSKKFEIIYADPPWRYDFSKSNSREIENQYPTMSVDEICALNVPSHVNAVLYLWATAPKLREALKVMEAWGFEYKTHAIWDKDIIGMGYWFRGQHELLLVGVKGKYSPPTPSYRLSSVYRERRSQHSKKLQAIRDHITAWTGNASKLEIFAREKSPMWDIWGNQIENTVLLSESK